MNARIAQLEALLSRVQERAKLSRTLAQPSEEPEEDLGELEPIEAVLASSDLPIAELDEPELDIPTTFEDDDGEGLVFDETPPPESGSILSKDPMDLAFEEGEDEAPLTPPPESGQEFARPQGRRSDGPTIEQVGETVPLEEGNHQEFELDEPDFSDAPEESTVQINRSDIAALMSLASDPLEVVLPTRSQVPPLVAPDSARAELERFVLGEATPIEARVSKRAALTTSAVDLVSASRDFKPDTFADLLDASLSLK